MSTEKYPAELVEKVAKAGYEAAFALHDPAMVDRWEDLDHDDDPSVEAWRRIAVAALDALDLSVTERWQAEWRGRMGVSACATDSRENAIVLAGEGGTVRRRTELYAETPWEVVTDE